MGLDMYLNKRKNVTYTSYHTKVTEVTIKQFNDDDPTPTVDEIKLFGKEASNSTIYIETQVAYWRKANQIHRWFVEHIQDGEDNCQSYSVSCEQLQELVNLCKELLKDKDPEKAKELLPTSEGFFFGGTDYDKYYWEDLENTVNQLEQQLEEDATYSYCSSW